MKYKLVLSLSFFLAGVFCASTDSNIDKPLPKKADPNAIIFKARLIAIGNLPVPAEQVSGVYYETSAIENPGGTCDLVVGHDANFLITLEDIQYVKNTLNVATADTFRLHVHSPVLVFSTEPAGGGRYEFRMFYTIDNSNRVHFTLLQAVKAD